MPEGRRQADVVTIIEETTEATPRTAPVDPGDHDKFAHYVFPASEVTRAMVEGTPCTALCGKVWVPSRDPERYPVCPECQAIADTLPDTPSE